MMLMEETASFGLLTIFPNDFIDIGLMFRRKFVKKGYLCYYDSKALK